MDLIASIRRSNRGRDPERLQLKFRRMRVDDFAFLRGTAHLFHEHLPAASWLASAPLTWSCGDLHLENFGSYKADNRQVYFDINDFDEATLAPAHWDLLRLMTSLRVAGQVHRLPEDRAEALVQGLLEAYVEALSAGKAYWVERETAQGPVRTLLDGLRQRRRADLLAVRTHGQGLERRLRVDGEKALPATNAQRGQVIEALNRWAHGQTDPKFFEVLDVARRIAGTGSLGLDRYVVLVHGRGGPQGQFLLDLKPVPPSSMAEAVLRRVPAKRLTGAPAWPSQAERAVQLQQRMQAVPMAFLHVLSASHTGERRVLRALQPSEDRIEWRRSLMRDEHAAPQAVGDMGRLLAWAQLRSAGRQGSASVDELMAFARRRKWKGKVMVLSGDMAQQVHEDACVFNAAFDDGRFQD